MFGGALFRICNVCLQSIRSALLETFFVVERAEPQLKLIKFLCQFLWPLFQRIYLRLALFFSAYLGVFQAFKISCLYSSL